MSDAGPYKLEHAPDVLAQIQAIKQHAKQTGQYEQFVKIMEEAVRRLQADPRGWGDPIYQAKTIDAVACRGLIRPVVFRYAVYEQVRTVVLLSVRRYADFD